MHNRGLKLLLKYFYIYEKVHYETQLWFIRTGFVVCNFNSLIISIHLMHLYDQTYRSHLISKRQAIYSTVEEKPE